MKQLLLSALLSASAFAAVQEEIRVEVNGILATYDGTPPQIRQGRVLIPVRGVLEQLGADVRWDDANQTVSATKDGNSFTLKIGSRTVTRNGQPIQLDVPATVLKGRTMVPLRFVSEALGARVRWNGLERTASIDTGN